MSLPGVIPMPPFPNVPQLPGVPQLPRQARAAIATETQVVTLLAAGRLIQQLFTASQSVLKWGLLDSAFNVVIEPDNFLAFDNRNEWRVLDYPVQDGSFASYNKVTVPFEISVRMSKGGSVSDREQFLATLDKLAADFNLYTLVTPERSYTNLNITRYEVTRRGAQGAYFLAEVDLYLRQIRTIAGVYSAAQVDTSNAKPPSAIPVQNLGPVLPGVVPNGAASKAAAAVVGVPF